MRLGQFEPAVEHSKKALAVLPHYDAYRNVLSLAYAWSGRKEDALEVISGMLRDRENQEPIRAYDISLSYHAVGRDDEALQWLEKSYEEDKLYTLDALSQPFFGELHWDPRYRSIVDRSGLPHRLDYVRKALKIQREGKDHHSSE
jgi:tetratricopeptide (TPR) repeat protein